MSRDDKEKEVLSRLIAKLSHDAAQEGVVVVRVVIETKPDVDENIGTNGIKGADEE